MGLNGARETLGILNAQFSILEDISRKLAVTPFKDSDIPQLVEKSGLVPSGAASTRAKNIIDEVLLRFHHGQGAELESSKGTAWGAYNAVVEYVDHYRGKNAEKRAESAILGSGSAIKESAFSLLSA